MSTTMAEDLGELEWLVVFEHPETGHCRVISSSLSRTENIAIGHFMNSLSSESDGEPEQWWIWEKWKKLGYRTMRVSLREVDDG